MRPTTAATIFSAVLFSACTSAAVEEMKARGETWPFGWYQLVSVDGHDLPVQVSTGQTLMGGSCTLARRQAGGIRFRFSFGYEGKPRTERDYAARALEGRMILQGSREGSAQRPVRFLIEERGEFEDAEWGGTRTYAVEEEAQGSLFGNELTLRDGETAMVFFRRPNPRRRQ